MDASKPKPQFSGGVAKPPKIEEGEVEILNADQIAAVLDALKGHSIYPIAALAIATGMRRGELLALCWKNVNLDASEVKVERSLEQTKAGLRFKAPKTKHGRRTISLPASAADMLREHRKKQLELRFALGMGKPGAEALVFCSHDGKPLSPNYLSIQWRRAANLPKVTFHALRHSHASALIAAGIDVVTVSRRLGHASPNITLGVYARRCRSGSHREGDPLIRYQSGTNSRFVLVKKRGFPGIIGRCHFGDSSITVRKEAEAVRKRLWIGPCPSRWLRPCRAGSPAPR